MEKDNAQIQRDNFFLTKREAGSRLKKEKISFVFTGGGVTNKDVGCFHSAMVYVKGSKVKGINLEMLKRVVPLLDDGIELLPGVFCPDCGAQGYKTDHKDIATCGAYAGWFFFYRSNSDLNEVKDEKKKEIAYEIKIVNGQYVKVPKLNFNNKSPIISKEIK